MTTTVKITNEFGLPVAVTAFDPNDNDDSQFNARHVLGQGENCSITLHSHQEVHIMESSDGDR